MILTNGFEVEIPDERLDDWEVLECIDELDEHPERAARLTKMLLGVEDYNRLKEHCREDGKVSMTYMMEALKEILNENNKSKNS